MKLTIETNLAGYFNRDESLILSQLHYWLSTKKYGVQDEEGRNWIFNTLEQWQEQLHYFSRSTLWRLFKKLRDKGVVLFAQLDKKRYQRRGYYSINYQRLAELCDGHNPFENNDVPTGETSSYSFSELPMFHLLERHNKTQSINSSTSSQKEKGKDREKPKKQPRQKARGFSHEANFGWWYSVMRKHGNVTGKEFRDGVQWVNLNGDWQPFDVAVQRWTFEYLEKMQRRR